MVCAAWAGCSAGGPQNDECCLAVGCDMWQPPGCLILLTPTLIPDLLLAMSSGCWTNLHFVLVSWMIWTSWSSFLKCKWRKLYLGNIFSIAWNVIYYCNCCSYYYYAIVIIIPRLECEKLFSNTLPDQILNVSSHKIIWVFFSDCSLSLCICMATCIHTLVYVCCWSVFGWLLPRPVWYDTRKW